jgi:hypothetical protein
MHRKVGGTFVDFTNDEMGVLIRWQQSSEVAIAE